MKVKVCVGLVGLALLLAIPPTLAQNQTRTAAYSVIYGAENEGGRRLDVYVPEDLEPPYPVVLAFPGSGGDKADIIEFGIPDIAARAGAAIVTVSYATDDPVSAYRDAWCALAWMQVHGIDYGLDTSRIVTLGHSYGGLPATMLALQDDPAHFGLDCPYPAPNPDPILGVVSIAGVLLGSADALEAFNPDGPVWQDATLAATLRETPPEAWLTLDLTPEQRNFLEMWPMAWIDHSDPPHLLMHGAVDTIIPFENSYAYAEILTRNAINVAVVTDRYSGHVPPPFAYDREMIVFLQRVFGL
jgi:acetyl esterase/lipase